MVNIMNDEKIEKENRLMILFDNIKEMDDTEIVVFLHNLAHYLYDRTKGDLYLIEGKEIEFHKKRMFELLNLTFWQLWW